MVIPLPRHNPPCRLINLKPFRKNVGAGYLATEAVEFLHPYPLEASVRYNVPHPKPHYQRLTAKTFMVISYFATAVAFEFIN